MPTIIAKPLQLVAVSAFLLVVYNMYIFLELATGKHIKFIPWLHFPLKLFVQFAN